MADPTISSRHYQHLAQRFPETIAALETLGATIRQAGPVTGKTTELIKLAAAAAIQSKGAVRSHARRALEAGASPEEIDHALLLLVSTIGFPRVAAAMSWAGDLVSKE